MPPGAAFVAALAKSGIPLAIEQINVDVISGTKEDLRRLLRRHHGDSLLCMGATAGGGVVGAVNGPSSDWEACHPVSVLLDPAASRNLGVDGVVFFPTGGACGLHNLSLSLVAADGTVTSTAATTCYVVGSVESPCGVSQASPALETPVTSHGVRAACDRWATDKGTLHHRYDRFYWRYLPPRSAARTAVIGEIGLLGGSSVAVWRELYPDAWIVGLDRNIGAVHKSYHTAERTIVLEGDQGIRADVRRMAAAVPAGYAGFDVVIDDGSHWPQHQLFSLGVLWPAVVPGGTYIVEDVEMSYWSDDVVIDHFDLVHELKGLADCVNRLIHGNDATCKVRGHALPDVETVTFAANAVILTKVHRQDRYLYGAPYRLKHLLGGALSGGG